MAGRHLSAFAERLSDETLVRRALGGDEVAFADLARRYSGRLARYAAGLLGERAAGERIAELALADAREALRQGFAPVSVRPWLYRITLNRALEERPCAGPSGASSPCPRPERECRAAVLRQVHGLSVREIAEQLELTPQEVERALFSSRRALEQDAAAEAPPRRPGRKRAVRVAGAIVIVTAGAVLGPLAARDADAPAQRGVPAPTVARATADADGPASAVGRELPAAPALWRA